MAGRVKGRNLLLHFQMKRDLHGVAIKVQETPS